jgi:hypothetical protein
MTTYYVATLARYVIVDAANETEARKLVIPALEKLQAETGRNVPVEIRTVRPATANEIELANWHRHMKRCRYGGSGLRWDLCGPCGRPRMANGRRLSHTGSSGGHRLQRLRNLTDGRAWLDGFATRRRVCNAPTPPWAAVGRFTSRRPNPRPGATYHREGRHGRPSITPTLRPTLVDASGPPPRSLFFPTPLASPPRAVARHI